MSSAELPAHVQAILDSDVGLEECFDIMRAAQVKAEYRFHADAPHSNEQIEDAVKAMMEPLRDLSAQAEATLRQLEERLLSQQRRR